MQCVTVQLFRECLAQPAGEQFGQFGPGFAALFPATVIRCQSVAECQRIQADTIGRIAVYRRYEIGQQRD